MGLFRFIVLSFCHCCNGSDFIALYTYFLLDLDKFGCALIIKARFMVFGLHKFYIYRQYPKENRLVYTKVSQPIRP